MVYNYCYYFFIWKKNTIWGFILRSVNISIEALDTKGSNKQGMAIFRDLINMSEKIMLLKISFWKNYVWFCFENHIKNLRWVWTLKVKSKPARNLFGNWSICFWKKINHSKYIIKIKKQIQISKVMVKVKDVWNKNTSHSKLLEIVRWFNNKRKVRKTWKVFKEMTVK